MLKKKGTRTNIGDESGFAPHTGSNVEAIETVLAAIDAAGYQAGSQVFIAMDAANSGLYKEGQYVFHKNGGQTMSSDELVKFWTNWASPYPIVSIEDGMAEDDWEGWAALNPSIGNKVQLVGDVSVCNQR